MTFLGQNLAENRRGKRLTDLIGLKSKIIPRQKNGGGFFDWVFRKARNLRNLRNLRIVWIILSHDKLLALLDVNTTLEALRVDLDAVEVVDWGIVVTCFPQRGDPNRGLELQADSVQ